MVELKKNKRIYAMKVIKKELVTDDEDIDWVQTEKHVFETASNHPFLVGLHSCFQVIHISDFREYQRISGDKGFHASSNSRTSRVHSLPASRRCKPYFDIHLQSDVAVFHCYRRRRGCSS